MGNIRISVIVCTRNRSATIRNLLQRFVTLAKPKSWELIIIDQSDNDDTQHICETFTPIPIRYRKTPDRGLGKARNEGINIARGAIVAFTDDDCLPDKHWLQCISTPFTNPGITGVFGRVRPYQPDRHGGQWCPCTFEKKIPAVITGFTTHWDHIGFGNNMAFRTSILRKERGFKPWLGSGSIGKSAEDAEMALRLLIKEYRLKYDPRAVIYHNRWLSDSSGTNQLTSYIFGEMVCYGYYAFQGIPIARQVVLRNLKTSVRETAIGVVRSFRQKRNIRTAAFSVRSLMQTIHGLLLGCYFAFADPIPSPTPSFLSSLANYRKQGSAILLSVIAGKAISLLWKLFLARNAPLTLGSVEIAMTIFFTFQAFSLLGFQTALMRFVSIAKRTGHRHEMARYLYLSVGITSVFAVGIAGYFFLIPAGLVRLFQASSLLVEQVIPYLWVVPVLTMSELLWAYMAATGTVWSYAVGKYILPPITRLISLFAVTSLFHPQHIVMHIALAAFLTWAWSAIVTKRQLHGFPNRIQKDIGPYLRYTLPMSGSFLLYTVYTAVDTLFVAQALGGVGVGLKSALYMLTDIPGAVIAPVLNIFQLQLTPIHNNPEKGRRFTIRMAGLFLGVAGAIGGVVFLMRPLLVSKLLGPAYTPILPLVGGMMIAQIIESAIILPIRHTLDFYGRTNTTLYLMGITTIAKLAAGPSLIRSMGLSGLVALQLLSVGLHLMLTLYVFILRFPQRAGQPDRGSHGP